MNRLASLRIAMVSVVVSIRMRKIFAEVRKMFLYARMLSRMLVKGS